MGEIIFDESGELRNGIVYQFGIQFDDQVSGRDDTWVISHLTPSRDEQYRAGVEDKETWLWIDEGGDLAGGARLSDFIANPLERVICPASFLRRLHATPFRGYSATPYVYSENQSSHPHPELFSVWFLGINCRRVRRIVNAPNACPQCGHEPLICAERGLEPYACPECAFVFSVAESQHLGEGDLRLKARGTPPPSMILEGRRWDGSDFIAAGGWNFITKRVLDWLLAIHAAPFYVRPARICVDGMTDEQLRQLDEATKPIG